MCMSKHSQTLGAHLPRCHIFPTVYVYVFRFESSSAILGSMGEAADALVTSGMNTGQVACRVLYRLAHHADTLYASIQAQKQSPEWNTAQAVIKQKRQQVHTCNCNCNCCVHMLVTLPLCMAVQLPSWCSHHRQC